MVFVLHKQKLHLKQNIYFYKLFFFEYEKKLNIDNIL